MMRSSSLLAAPMVGAYVDTSSPAQASELPDFGRELTPVPYDLFGPYLGGPGGFGQPYCMGACSSALRPGQYRITPKKRRGFRQLNE